jgi:hypothetical protein
VSSSHTIEDLLQLPRRGHLSPVRVTPREFDSPCDAYAPCPTLLRSRLVVACTCECLDRSGRHRERHRFDERDGTCFFCPAVQA